MRPIGFSITNLLSLGYAERDLIGLLARDMDASKASIIIDRYKRCKLKQ